MMKKKKILSKIEVMNRIKEHYNYLKKNGYNVVFIAHQGSFNYGLEYEDSDVDTKAIVLPSFEDFVKGKTPISTTVELKNGDQIDIKDIRLMFDCFKKMNISYIELLYTKLRIIDMRYMEEFQELLDNRDKVANINRNQFLRCISDMSKEKVKALCHPYPKIKKKIDKYGFDGKQLSHCIRLCEFINKFVSGEPLEKCYQSDLKEELINIKKNLTLDGKKYMDLDIAKKICEQYDSLTYAIKEKNKTEEDIINKEGIDLLDNLKYDILKKKFIDDIRGDNYE